MSRFWVRWYGKPGVSFEYHGPWWQSGEAFGVGRDGSEGAYPIFVAAVVAHGFKTAMDAIEHAYGGSDGVQKWSFVNERADDWEPFCERFPRADWMRWP